MIDRIAGVIEATLKGLDLFKAVERTVNAKILQSPPSAAIFLAHDRDTGDPDDVTRTLGWDILLIIPALGLGKGQKSAGDCIDTVRNAFIGWLPWDGAGVMPARVPEVRLEGIEQTNLVYTVRLTMQAIPQNID